MARLNIAVSVVVDRTRIPQIALNATGRLQEVFSSVADNMPRGGKGLEVVEVEFFHLDQFVGDYVLSQLYAKHGITPDPIAVAAVNEMAPTFARDWRNGVHWQDGKGNWGSATFFCNANGYEPRLRVVPGGGIWIPGWWLGGIREQKPVGGLTVVPFGFHLVASRCP